MIDFLMFDTRNSMENIASKNNQKQLNFFCFRFDCENSIFGSTCYFHFILFQFCVVVEKKFQNQSFYKIHSLQIFSISQMIDYDSSE